MTDYTDYHGTWAIDPAHTRLGFVARHAMITKVRGSFTDVSGEVRIDVTDPAASTARVRVGLASVDTGSADRDNHLRSPDFFDAANNPEMTFVATGIQQRRDDFLLTGDLTVNGVTKPTTFQVEPTGVATDPFGNVRAGFEGQGELSRKDYDLTWNVALEAGGVLVSDKIRTQLDVSLVKQS